MPGLSCYSCPAAAASCPIGAIQAVIGSSKFHFAYYVVVFLLLIGTLLGRVVCGFLCPFGWFQEPLHKILTKKFSTKRFHVLTYLRYVILLLFVIILPMTVVDEVGMGDPFLANTCIPPGSWRAGSLCPWHIPVFRPVWAGSSPGRVASCWGCGAVGVLLPAILQMAVPSSGFLRPVQQVIPLPAGGERKPVYRLRRVQPGCVRWMWMYSVRRTIPNISAAGTVWPPVPVRLSPRSFL